MFPLKQEKKVATPQASSGSTQPTKKISSAQLRISKDLNESSLPPTCVLDFPDADDLFNFKLEISPDEGYYQGGKFAFNFKITSSYPFDPPKVKCETLVYHPNIDEEGNVCLNVLREEWNPVLTLDSVIIGLQFLFLEPNPTDPLNKDAAYLLESNPYGFSKNVETSIKGGYIDDTYWYGQDLIDEDY